MFLPPLAQFEGESNAMLYVGFAVVAAALVAFTLLMLVVKRYKRCPSNRVLVIYGKTGGAAEEGQGQAVKCLHGGASFVWPLIQDHDYLSLDPIQIEIPLRGALSMENIRVNVPSVFTVAVGTTPELMTNAAIRLLGLGTEEIKSQAQEIIFGQLRQVIASMRIEDINRDRDTFLSHVQNSVEPELRKIGLVLINVNITDIQDESGYIDAIGKKAASQAVQTARGDVADQEKLGEVRVAEAQREREIAVAVANKERELGTRGASRDQAIGVADYERDQAVGEQRAQFERDVQVKEAEREKRIKNAQADAAAVAGENEAAALVAASRATLGVKNAEAYQLAETRKREAEAAVQEAAFRAMTKAALAEAEKVEAEQRAELEAHAKAQKAKRIVDAEAAGEQRRIEADAEAHAIFAKFEAEARGQYEIMAKKAEGLERIVAACGGSDKAFQMLMLEHLDALTEASAKAISNIKFDKVVVWEGGGKNGQSSTAGFLQNMARTLPPMMEVMRDVAGIELPETLVKLAEDRDEAAQKGADKATQRATAGPPPPSKNGPAKAEPTPQPQSKHGDG
ncbi:flotillin family protein [Alienimonas californiensis]|uniref:flotillin family protein n=1 Tax=Alienimonas californiensis TaxID=2527989 RepID=UPI0011A21806|nr:flotillin family protein [Alienimonas californiensis]